MGNWKITVKGVGCHHNNDKSIDAHKAAVAFVLSLLNQHHAIVEATFDLGGVNGAEDVLIPALKEHCASEEEIAAVLKQAESIKETYWPTPKDAPEPLAPSDPKSITKVLEGEKAVSYAEKPPVQLTTDAAIIENKQFRVELDAILQRVKNSPRKSRHRSLVITELENAIMRCGMDLKELNEPNPYPNSYDPSNTKVEPTADGLKL